MHMIKKTHSVKSLSDASGVRALERPTLEMNGRKRGGEGGEGEQQQTCSERLKKKYLKAAFACLHYG